MNHLTDAEQERLEVALGTTEPRPWLSTPESDQAADIRRFEAEDDELALTEERLRAEAESRELTRGLAQCRGGKEIASLLALLDSLAEGGNQ